MWCMINITVRMKRLHPLLPSHREIYVWTRGARRTTPLESDTTKTTRSETPITIKTCRVTRKLGIMARAIIENVFFLYIFFRSNGGKPTTLDWNRHIWFGTMKGVVNTGVFRSLKHFYVTVTRLQLSLKYRVRRFKQRETFRARLLQNVQWRVSKGVLDYQPRAEITRGVGETLQLFFLYLYL